MMSLVRSFFGSSSSNAGPVKRADASLKEGGVNNSSPLNPVVGHMGRTSVQQLPASEKHSKVGSSGTVGDQEVSTNVDEGNGTWKTVPDKMTLENIETLDSHYELIGQEDGAVTYNENHRKPASSLERGARSMMRGEKQQEEYRKGIENVRGMLLEKYDQHAVDRFDQHFSYRVWAGKPLTVRALKVFLDEENHLRNETFNISKVAHGHNMLEKLQSSLSAAGETQFVIGSDKKSAAASTRPTSGECWTPFLPVKRSYFSTAANETDIREGEKDGIQEAQRIILEALAGSKEHTKTHISHLFETKFADKVKKGEPLTVKELRSFVDEAINVRNYETGILGGLAILMENVVKEGTDAATCVTDFLKGSYHALGVVAGASIMLDQARSTSDPIAVAIKEIFAGGVIASENDTERILTAAMLHFVGTPPAEQPSITSKIIKFFVPFY